MTELAGAAPAMTELTENQQRRAAYQEVIDGAFADGRRETITFCVYTDDLDEGRGDLFVAVGLALAMIDRGFGVRIVARDRWHCMEPSDIVIGLLPTFDPSLAKDAWKVAWVRNKTETWASGDHLAAYDQVIASSELALNRLRRAAPHAEGVLPIGVDVDLFCPPDDESARTSVAVTTANFWGSVRDVHRALMDLPDDADVVMFGSAKNAPDELKRWHQGSVSYFAIPAAYQRAGIVIDDMEPSTIGYGTANSRLFEAAACGALVISNGALGATKAGIDGVPVYRDAEDLASLLADLRADPTALAAAAAHLRHQVHEHHSWRARAASLERLLDAKRVDGVLRGVSRHAIHLFPDYRSTNPYQDMLYGGLASVGAFSLPVRDLVSHFRTRAEATVPGTVHVHWTAPILQWAQGPYAAELVLQKFTDALLAFKAAGGNLIWTIHNLLPHDGKYRSAELTIADLLSEHADLIHVLTEETLVAADDLFTVDPSKVAVIEHSSYLGQYPDWIGRSEARRRLGITPHEKVLVALGGIRPYKGLSRLVDIFEEMAASDPSLRLLIAGKPSRLPGVEKLKARCEESSRIISRFDFVPDDQLQVWMRAADLAVLPYHQVLNSGAYLLAQTFDLPVVAPRTGAISSADVAHVRLFDPQDDASLKSTLERAVRDLIDDEDAAGEARAAARVEASRRLPADMAHQFATALASRVIGGGASESCPIEPDPVLS